ncbi:MAG TPA: GtrA family protein [Acidobacteriota bacterium]|nr:GtrA family protein [Acidobacteriota bacterium]
MSITSRTPSIVKRWIVFNLVGTMGILVQMGTLWVLDSVVHIHYLVATALAVEIAVLHNFIWHERWTWADRAAKRTGVVLSRLLCFHLTNGLLSIAGNLFLTRIFVEKAGYHYMHANALAIGACAILNFLSGDRFVFRSGREHSLKGDTTMIHKSKGIAALLFVIAVSSGLFTPIRAYAADLHPETVKAWNSSVEATELRIAGELSSQKGFLALDFQDSSASAKERQEVLSGQIPIKQVSIQNAGGKAIDVPDGMIHHWRGSVFIPGVPLDFIFSRVTNPGKEDMRQEDVLDSRVLESEPGQLRLYLKLQRSKIITVVYNTEHLVRYNWQGLSQAFSSSTATKISEIERLHGNTEMEKPEGHDRGFLWRLNSYWRYQQVPGGVIVECESMTLSRSIPPIFEYLVRPIINEVARESMHRTLQSLKVRILQSYSLHAAGSRT